MTDGDGNGSSTIQKVFVGIGVLAGICGILTFFFGINTISEVARIINGEAWDSDDLDTPDVPDRSARAGLPSKAKYIQEADATCTKWYRESGRLDAKVQRNPDTEPSWQTYSQMISVGDSMITEWGALPSPVGGEAEIEAFLNREREGLAIVERQRDALFKIGDESLRDVTQEFNDWDADADSWRARARSYGFRVCLS
ncbi:hypothetical protein QFZ24_006067 [Streptomyces phaeochromogenes]|uniref:hypothetical protein n=1 Tax=Streptomyces phaeochromogenes TaxID=1923 RepID=UPI002791A5D9|nr:hypothetical protein [Streptomyces phaeochromogenes]MDQ0952144.1 hypothetical protein [Streptomyces phaeochromogenes]